MPSFTTLPLEIVSNILSNLPKKDVYECMNVCKTWYSLGSAIYYEEIDLRLGHKEFLALTEKVRLNGRKLGDLVKRINFNTTRVFGHEIFDGEEFYRLMHNLPRLQIIHTDDAYINYLPFVPISSLKQIEKINLFACFVNQTVYDDHFLSNIRFADRITTLKLESTNIKTTNNDCRELLKELSTFKCLKNLSITNEVEEEATINPEYLHLTSILNACNNLESLQFKSKFGWEIDTVTNHVYTKLTALKLEVLYLTEEHMSYIMECVPNLKTLVLTVEHMYFEEILLNSKPKVLKQFAEYLWKLDSFAIRRGPIDGIVEAEKNQALWRFVRDLCRNGEVDCSLSVVVVQEETSSRSTCIWKKSGVLHIRCSLLLCQPISPSWISQINFLTFKTIHIQNNSLDMYNENHELISLIDVQRLLINPILQLLIQQCKQPCSIRIENPKVCLVFGNFRSSAWSKKIRSGRIKGLVLENEMMLKLGRMYPFVETLVLKQCLLEQQGEGNNHTSIDLSSFGNLAEVTIDLDTLFGDKKLSQPLYIQMVSINEPLIYDYFKAQTENDITHLGNQIDDVIDTSSFVIKIMHVQIKHLRFKRHSVELKIIEAE